MKSGTTNMSPRLSYRPCLTILVRLAIPLVQGLMLLYLANSFTPWFKLIARDFLFGWWDQLLANRKSGELVDALSLSNIIDGSKVVKMV